MTNQCSSCAYSIHFERSKTQSKLICQHEKMDAINCDLVQGNCRHFEYEAGTDAGQQGGGEPKPTT